MRAFMQKVDLECLVRCVLKLSCAHGVNKPQKWFVFIIVCAKCFNKVLFFFKEIINECSARRILKRANLFLYGALKKIIFFLLTGGVN
jgi:hypothetical protein